MFETRKMFAIFYNIFLFHITLLSICFLTVCYAVVDFTVCLITYVFEYIDSIERPWFVKFRQFLKRYFRMMFFDKTYKRFGYDEEAIKKGDDYIDKMLEDMFNNKEEEYDPYDLEDSAVGFHRKVMFVNVSGEAKLHDGYIKGLSTLHRAKHCSLHNEGNKLRVRADLGAGELEFHYKGTVKFMNFGPTITVTGTLSYIEVFLEFKVNSETGRDGKLTKFTIDDMRGMKVRVSGLGPINWAVNPIISGVTKVFKRFVRNFMEHKVEKHISEHIPNYQFPVEGGETTETPETIPTQTEETTPPETETPETEEPETETPEPETEEPETEEPETEEPEPETEAPETEEPDTEAPETEEPETEAPETEEPETEAPETEEPETEAPETEAPEPETDAPEIPEPENPEPDPEDNPDVELLNTGYIDYI